MRQIYERPAVPSFSDVKASDRFVDLWKSIGILQFIPNSGFSQMPYDLYCLSLRAKAKKRVCKQYGIYYIDVYLFIDEEEDISYEEEENPEILVADGDDNHATIINIYELLTNSEFTEIQTDREE